jgi:hypothetical protein
MIKHGLWLIALILMAPGLTRADTPAESDTLPHVLLIGDSISIGYTKHVQKELEGKATVVHHKGNAGPTSNGLEKLDSWLGETKWDVIHFNWGLHDLCYRHPDSKVYGKRDKENGTLSTTPEQYEKNLETLVTRLEATGATLIWASITVVPEGEAGRFVGDDVKYNTIAERVMTKHGIPVNDLYALTKAFPPESFSKPGDVHYTNDGYARIGKQVAHHIQEALQKK